ncbi:winged helix-turn-helix domain-containing protein [Haloprofundus salilacus]|uniref:winged helix-turn-helix domain-containing protein n=1 Tax=Haloprofundus salilacus TaxID=2876190 RepID=UPI00295E7B9B|nr:winged helix-turn-helix domain-containing protein [Haloprofundus salilacus]
MCVTTQIDNSIRFRVQSFSSPRTLENHCIPDLFHGRMSDSDVTENIDLSEILDLFDDDLCRSILIVTSEKPLSANELSEQCDVSPSTIYRRVERLKAASLLQEQTRPRRDGHHETVYVTQFDRFELTIQEGDVDWKVDRQERDVADALTRMWGRF